MYLILLFMIILVSDAYLRPNIRVNRPNIAVFRQAEDEGEEGIFDDLEVEDDGDIPSSVRKKIIEAAPSDIDMKMEVMGFTPLTKAGFALAGVILVLNTVLGTGWASDIFFRNAEQTERVGMRRVPLTQLRESPYIDRSSIKSFTLDGREYQLE